MNCKSVSVTTGPTSSLLQPKLFLRFYLLSICYMTSMPKDFKILKKNILDIFLLLVPLEASSHYLDIDISHWLEEDLQSI